jgi:hypothetical protein
VSLTQNGGHHVVVNHDRGLYQKKAILNLIPIQVFFIAVLFTRREILQNYRSLPDGLHVAKKEKKQKKAQGHVPSVRYIVVFTVITKKRNTLIYMGDTVYVFGK